jgi:hypothetical protein
MDAPCNVTNPDNPTRTCRQRGTDHTVHTDRDGNLFTTKETK